MTNEVTNEVMAFELIQESEYLSDDFGKAFFDCEMAEKMLLRMAERKDQQFKEYLEKKNTEISNTKAKLDRGDADYMLYTLKSLFIDEIINELFKEE